MSTGGKQLAARISSDRLAAVAGGGASVAVPAGGAPASPVQRGAVQPDLSRIRKCAINETPAERKKRLAAKTINYTATIIARIAIIAAACYYGWEHYQMTGAIHRGFATGVFVVIIDIGRVAMKAMEPGSK